MLRAQNTIMSRMIRIDGRIGKIHSFCAMYSLRMSAWIVPDRRFRSQPRDAREGHVHREQDPRGRIDGHRDRDALEVDVGEQRLHVVEGVHRHALAADLAERARVVRVVAHERGHVEVHAEAGLALGDQVAEAPVGVLAGAEAGDLAHRPQPAAVHRRVRPARVRKAPGQAEVLASDVPATCSGVYTRSIGRPDPVRYRSRASGWRARNSRSSPASQASREDRARATASGSNMPGPPAARGPGAGARHARPVSER